MLNQVETSTCFVVDKVLELAWKEFPYWQQHTQPKSGFHLCPYPIHWRHIQSDSMWSHNVHYFLPRNEIWLTVQKFGDTILKNMNYLTSLNFLPSQSFNPIWVTDSECFHSYLVLIPINNGSIQILQIYKYLKL